MSKNKVKVIIGGNIYALQGDESQEHIHKVASLINEKINSIQQSNVRTSLNTSRVYMLTALNIASEYIKTEEELEAYTTELQKCSAENLALKDKIREMTVELTELKNQIISTSGYHKKNDTKNRGR
ncbi:cell division protein ZapA [Cellulosilyticum sp. I15G10I2]|uniref:cell division protein ZapA n=1 Tax=Cellulosilyticum sp. I15G10I2 TaxID=1892843 RepID=UPI00085C526F|nr:cell division protein ZapA [Cellulosilyticum sp. I15G10I2]